MADPGEDVDFVLFDAFGAEENFVGNFARDANYAVNVAHDDVARAYRYLTDFDRRLVVRNHAAAERAVRDAVLVEDGELLLQYLLRVADAASDNRAANALRHGGRRHHSAPKRRLDVIGSIPDDNSVRLEVIEHLGAEGHLALDHDVRRGLHGERLAADDHIVSERHDLVRKVLVQ